MDILMCYNYFVGNAGSDGFFDLLLERFPNLEFEANFEQVLAKAKDGEIGKLVIWVTGYNWSHSKIENVIYAQDVVGEIRKVDKGVKIFALGVGEGYRPPDDGIVPWSGMDSDARNERIIEFLEADSGTQL